jgi:hypothetical protein
MNDSKRLCSESLTRDEHLLFTFVDFMLEDHDA